MVAMVVTTMTSFLHSLQPASFSSIRLLSLPSIGSDVNLPIGVPKTSSMRPCSIHETIEVCRFETLDSTGRRCTRFWKLLYTAPTFHVW